MSLVRTRCVILITLLRGLFMAKKEIFIDNQTGNPIIVNDLFIKKGLNKVDALSTKDKKILTSYGCTYPLTIETEKTVQELQDRVNELEAQVASLKAEVASKDADLQELLSDDTSKQK